MSSQVLVDLFTQSKDKLSTSDSQWLHRLFARTFFLSGARDIPVGKGVDLYFQSICHPPPHINPWHRTLTYLLPQMEHALRRIWVGVNHLPPAVLCAQSHVHFSTLDLFLARDLEVEVQVRSEERRVGKECRYR